MDALVADASREGTLNVIALPPDWANYGNILKAFTNKYGIKINSANPDGSSQDEINAVKQLGTQDRAPDVLDLGQSFANTNTALFAPYKVATWDTIPAANKDPNGAWVNDYGGYISIGCNNKIVPNCPTTFADLLKPEYKGQVALNGDPTQAAAAFAGVWASALANGGSLDNIQPGIDFWGKVSKAGNLLKVDPNSATIESGQTPIVLDWDYLNVTQAEKVKASFHVERRRSHGRPVRPVLRPGDQQERAAPGRGPALAGVPLLRRGPEPLAAGQVAAGAAQRDAAGGHGRQGGPRRAPAGDG